MSDFICHRCGKCCGFVPFTASEYSKIKREAKKMHVSFVKGYLEGRLVFYPERLLKKIESVNLKMSDDEIQSKINSLVCPFLERNALGICSCKIYDKRPEVCRLFGSGKHPYLVCPHNKGVKHEEVSD